MTTTDATSVKQFLCVIPVLVTQDISQTIHHYEQKLGFKKDFDYGMPVFYAGVSRDGFDFHFRQGDPANARQKTECAGIDVYVSVYDVDGLFGELTVRGANIIYGPANHDYGMREFHVEDCNGYRIGFAQEI